ncbi:hypothetical protein AAKU61_002672 [Undibacterium sp. GrIS 1.2]|uniref:DUF3617 domain-containing protein n=1 Tax=Undibacterium sp. GrIS 1.2 TaxID=3143933 RepID=UPI003399EC79
MTHLIPKTITIISLCFMLTPQVYGQSIPRSGNWDTTFTAYMYMHDKKIYAPWIQPMGVRFMSETDLKQLPFSPAGSKAKTEEDVSSCVVSEEKQRLNVLTWRMICKESDGRESETKTKVTMTETEIQSSSVIRDNSPIGSLGPDGMKTEFLMKRVGDCEKITDEK